MTTPPKPLTEIDLDQIDQYGPQTIEATLSFAGAEFDGDEVASISPVSIAGEASAGDLPKEYVITGSVAFTAELNCSRCLEPFPFANRSEFDLRYRPAPDDPVETELEVEITAEELDLDFYSRDRIIPLAPLVAEQIQLSIPMKPLCREDCQGLCPLCGADLNQGSCGCRAPISDERWNALRTIRETLTKKDV